MGHMPQGAVLGSTTYYLPQDLIIIHYVMLFKHLGEKSDNFRR